MCKRGILLPRRLANLIRKTNSSALEDLSHFPTEPAAEKLAESHPDAAAKLHRAMGLRIVNAGKSTYYDAALENFACAKKCFEKTGLREQRDILVGEILAEHSRKTSLMPGFRALLAQGTVPGEPTFIERVRERRSRQVPSG